MAEAPHITINEGTTPTATPSSGQWYVYTKSSGLYIKDDAGNEYPISTITPEITVHAQDMYPSTTTGTSAVTQTEYATNDVDLKNLPFVNTGSNVFGQFTLWMPDDYNGGTLTAKFMWTADGGTGDVILGIQGRAFADDDAIDQAWGTAQEVTDTLLTADDIHITSATSAITLAGSPSGGQLVQFRIYRDVDDAGDTIADTVRIFAIKLYYSRS